MKKLVAGILSLALVAGLGVSFATAEDAAPAAGAEAEHATPHYPLRHPKEQEWSFAGPFGKYDKGQLQRGLKVYTEVCSACHSLRLVVMEGVPWPRPTVLHAARRAAGGGSAYDDQVVRARLAQAFGRLIRRKEDRGIFVLLSAATPSRLLNAFPLGVTVRRVSLAEAIERVRSGLSTATSLGHQAEKERHPKERDEDADAAAPRQIDLG